MRPRQSRDKRESEHHHHDEQEDLGAEEGEHDRGHSSEAERQHHQQPQDHYPHFQQQQIHRSRRDKLFSAANFTNKCCGKTEEERRRKETKTADKNSLYPSMEFHWEDRIQQQLQFKLKANPEIVGVSRNLAESSGLKKIDGGVDDVVEREAGVLHAFRHKMSDKIDAKETQKDDSNAGFKKVPNDEQQQQQQQQTQQQQKNNETAKPPSLKSILLYSGLGGWRLPSGSEVFKQQQCEVQACHLYDDRALMKDADVVIFQQIPRSYLLDDRPGGQVTNER
jgi:hypothetical protein